MSNSSKSDDEREPFGRHRRHCVSGMEADWLVSGGRGSGDGNGWNGKERFDRVKGEPAITARQAMR